MGYGRYVELDIDADHEDVMRADALRTLYSMPPRRNLFQATKARKSE
jgi:hypothetical protein